MTPAARGARNRAGLPASEVARRLGITPAYLRRVEREGVPYGLAVRLARLYGCSLSDLARVAPDLTRTSRAGQGCESEPGRPVAARAGGREP